MNEYDLSDAITETVVGALNIIKFSDGVECQRGNDAANR